MDEEHENDDWKNWFKMHGPKLLLCARQWTRSLADAEDVLQEAFVRYWRNQRELPGDPRALLITSIRRAALDQARRNTRRIQREDKVQEPGGGFFEAATGDHSERRAEIELALLRLPLEQREVLVLKIWNELTFEQISESLEISPNTAASRYRYALTALRKVLGSVYHG